MINNNGCSLPGLAQARAPWQRQLIRFSILLFCVLFVFSLIPVSSFAASSSSDWVYGSFEAPPIPDYNPHKSYYIAETLDGKGILLAELDLISVVPDNDGFWGIHWDLSYSFAKHYYLYDSNGQVTNNFENGIRWGLIGSYTNGTSSLANLVYLWSNFDLPSNNGYSYTGSFPIIPNSNEYVIIRMGNPSDQYWAGYSFLFQVFNTNDLTTPLSADWFITGDNISSLTTMSSTGILDISILQEPTSITVTASNINNTSYTTSIYINTLPYESIDPPVPSPTPDASNQDVIDSIDQGFDGLGNKVDEGFEGLGNKLDEVGDTLLGGIFRLFVPSVDDFLASITDFNDWLEQKFPLLSIPLLVVEYTFQLFSDVVPELTVLTFPEISWMGHTLIEETPFDFSQYAWLNAILPIIRLLLTTSVVYVFIDWVLKKVKEVGHL